uniref:ABC transport system permease protein n=1 Tax=Streptomyces sp. NBC_00049 TaxID=2903617 RepID=A0AAU2JH09_9ACTN
MTRRAPTTADGRGLRPAPWVRTRLRAAPLTVLLGACLAFVVVLLAAALPRATDRGADQALRSFLHDQGPSPTSLMVTTSARYGPQTAQELASALATLRSRTGGAFHLDASGPVHGARGFKTRALTNPGLARPDRVDPRLGLVYLAESAAHTTLVAGHWPGAAAPGAPVPVALSRKASETLRAPLGTVLDAAPNAAGTVRAEVVGIYDADPDDVFWTDLPCLTKACAKITTSGLPEMYWETAALVHPDAIDLVAPWGEGADYFWRLPVDTGILRTDVMPGVRKEVSAFVAGPTASELALAIKRPDLRVASRLPQLFKEADARQRGAAPLAAIGPAGVGGVAVVVICLAAALTGDRREAELRLLLARGGSRRSIVRRLLGESAVTVLPAAVLATWLAVLLLPTPRLAPSLTAAAAVTLLTLLAFPVRAFVLLSPPRPPAPRRRLVAESLVLAATAVAVFEVRRRGVSPAAGFDPLLVAAPLLLALSGALVLARLQPLLVGALARASGRGPGLIGFLGLARAARGTGGRARPSVLPLVALMLAVTTGGFGATVLGSVDTVRMHVARQSVGGDARISAPAGHSVPPELIRAADALPGVRTPVSAWVEEDAYLFGTERDSRQVTVVVADPVAYAALARTLDHGRFDPALLSGGVPGAPVPALFSSDLLARPGDQAYRIRVRGEDLQVKVAQVVDGTPALPGAGAATLVLPEQPVTALLPRVSSPNRWFATGPVDPDRLAESVRTGAPAATARNFTVRTSADAAAELSDAPLQHSAGRLFWASVAGAAGFALLAVLLTLVRAAPDRAALLARLRTMGLRPRQGLALILAETLPQALVAALGGAVAAAAAVALLGPAVDLSALVGAQVPTGLWPTAEPLLAQALGLAALVAVVVLAEAAVSGRRQITTELRAGDQR